MEVAPRLTTLPVRVAAAEFERVLAALVGRPRRRLRDCAHILSKRSNGISVRVMSTTKGRFGNFIGMDKKRRKSKERIIFGTLFFRLEFELLYTPLSCTCEVARAF